MNSPAWPATLVELEMMLSWQALQTGQMMWLGLLGVGEDSNVVELPRGEKNKAKPSSWPS